MKTTQMAQSWRLDTRQASQSFGSPVEQVDRAGLKLESVAHLPDGALTSWSDETTGSVAPPHPRVGCPS